MLIYANNDTGYTYSIRLILEITDMNDNIEAKTISIIRKVMSTDRAQDQLEVICETKIYPKDGYGRILPLNDVNLEQWLTHKEGIYRLAGYELFRLKERGNTLVP